VQIDPIKSLLKAPGANCLKLKRDEVLSPFAFNLKLRRYRLVFTALFTMEVTIKLIGSGRAGRTLLATSYNAIEVEERAFKPRRVWTM
jgi:hypothetical protein